MSTMHNDNNNNKLEKLLNSVGIYEQDFFNKEIPLARFEKLAALLDLYGYDAGFLHQLYDENEEKGTWVPKWKTWHLSWDEYLNHIKGLGM